MTEKNGWNESVPAEPEKCQGESLQDLENLKNTINNSGGKDAAIKIGV